MYWSIEVDDDIRLELLSGNHAEELFRVIDDCRQHLDPWLSWVRGTTRVEDARAFIEQARSQWAEGDGVQAAVVRRGELAGAVGINVAGNAGDLTFWLHPDYQGAGVATRSCRALVRHAFSEYDIRRCIVRAATENDRARATAKRLGFSRDATCRGARRHPDGHMDVDVYSLLRSEWEERS